VLTAALVVGPCADMSLAYTVRSIGDGFAATAGSIGLVVIAGSLIEVFLDRSGAGERLATAVLRVSGRGGGPAAMAVAGYLGGIAAFCDAAFVLLMPLVRAIARRSGQTPVTGAITLALALSATHGVLPPAPGPVAATAILSADLGRVALWGGGLAAILCVCGWTFAAAARPAPAASSDVPVEAPDPPPATAGRRGALVAALPILLPLLLLTISSLGHMPSEPLGGGATRELLITLGRPITLLLVAGGVVLLLPRPLQRVMLSENGWAGEAVARAAVTLLIVGAGGGFARVLQNAGIGEGLADVLTGAPLGILLPFAVAAVLKTAQGSSMLAVITTAGIIAPLLGMLGLEGETARALTVVAIGAGATVVSHANDSLFWVVTRLTGLSPAQGYPLLTLGTLLQGAVAAAMLAAIAAILR
jgi:GntP family gluconate:H+ symporter